MARTKISFNDRTYLYEQVAEILRDRIDRWDVAADGRLPSKRALCEELGISPRTLDSALTLLKAERYVETLIGKGIYALPPEERKN